MSNHKSSKISTGNYEYRGFRIEKVDGFDFAQWNIFENGCCDDSCDTLRDAKNLIDCIIGSRT